MKYSTIQYHNLEDRVVIDLYRVTLSICKNPRFWRLFSLWRRYPDNRFVEIGFSVSPL